MKCAIKSGKIITVDEVDGHHIDRHADRGKRKEGHKSKNNYSKDLQVIDLEERMRKKKIQIIQIIIKI